LSLLFINPVWSRTAAKQRLGMRQRRGTPIRWCCEICSVMLPRDVWPASGGSTVLRLEPLYRIRFTYPESWMVALDGGWEQHLFLAEGRCEGSISGRFRGANFPQRRTAAGPFRPDFRAAIDTDDGATILVEWNGYGRAYPPGRRQIVGCVFHLSDSERYRRLKDVVCVCVGEVRAPDDPDQDSTELVIDVAELIWEPIAEWRRVTPLPQSGDDDPGGRAPPRQMRKLRRLRQGRISASVHDSFRRRQRDCRPYRRYGVSISEIGPLPRRRSSPDIAYG